MTDTISIHQLSAEDAAEVEAVPGRIIAAWAAHDAAAFADVFTEDGTMILPGAFAAGRSAVREFMTQAFAGPYHGTQVTGSPVGLRFLAAETAILLTEGGVVAPGADQVDPSAAVRASWLLVRERGGWRIAAYQNSPRG